MITKKDILKILKQHQGQCKFHDAVEKAWKPFIVIDPQCKATDLFNFIQKKLMDKKSE